MQPPDIPSAFSFKGPHERIVYEKFLALGLPGAADYWRDACLIMAKPGEFRTASHLVSHCLRDILSALCDVLGEISKEHLPQPPTLIDDIKEAMTAMGIPESNAAARAWLEEHVQKRSSYRDEIKAALSVLDIAENDPVAQVWVEVAFGKDKTLHGMAHRRGLDGARPVNQDFGEWYARITSLFLRLLRGLEENFLRVCSVLDDMLARDAPTKTDINTLKGKVPQSAAALGYFFDRLRTPRWLGPLKKAGFFNKLPEPYTDGEMMFLPPWPAGRYLVEMASVEPKAVVSVIRGLPETKNYRVYLYLLDAAIAMPPANVAKIIDQADMWVRNKSGLGIRQRVQKLIERLAQSGEVDAAIRLARSFFSQGFDEGGARRAADSLDSMASFEYQQALAALNPVLTKAGSAKWVGALAGVLCGAIQQYEGTECSGGEDFSSVWCRSVEEDSEPAHGLSALLLVALRTAAETVMRESLADQEQVLGIVRAGQFRVFQRLEYHLLRLFPEGRKARIEEILGSREAYDQNAREYRMLLAAQFQNLSPMVRDRFLDWVAERQDVEADNGSSEDWERKQLRRLAGLRVVLPPEWQARYDELVKKYYDPPSPDWVAPRPVMSPVKDESPRSADELAAMTTEDLLVFLRTWQPTEIGFGAPSPEGLGQLLQQVVAKDPGRFANASESLKELAPTYVRHVLNGLHTACGAGLHFDWPATISLCEWVMQQPVTFEEDEDYLETDKGWRWSQGAVMDVLYAGLSPKNPEIPIALRDAVWRCIKPLTDSPDPTPRREKDAIEKHGEPLTQIAINSTRGRAIELVVRYALWLRRNFETAPSDQDLVKKGFRAMPEVRNLLEYHLDAKVDPSLTIRSVYGQWFPWLVMLDEAWAKENAGRIFPREDTDAKFFDAAWDTYVLSRVWDSVYEVLQEQYRHVVQSLDRPRKDVGHLGNPDMSLTEHLIVLFARGIIPEEDEAWQEFWNCPREGVRRKIITFVGDVFRQNESLPQNLATRLMSLVERRLDEAESAVAKGHSALEWKAFGWLFGAKNLDDEWLLKKLERVLGITGGKVDTDFQVLLRLPDMAGKNPFCAIKCLRLMVEADRDNWLAVGSEAGVRQILSAGIVSTDPNARKAARDLVNVLASRGHHQFKDLLGGNR